MLKLLYPTFVKARLGQEWYHLNFVTPSKSQKTTMFGLSSGERVTFWCKTESWHWTDCAVEKQRIACHRWVCWWAWSPILELQTRDGESNCHMAKRWGCCEVEPPSELLFYVPELRLANLQTGWLLRGTEFSRMSDPECRHPGPMGQWTERQTDQCNVPR